jgi:hypothetical protein
LGRPTASAALGAAAAGTKPHALHTITLLSASEMTALRWDILPCRLRLDLLPPPGGQSSGSHARQQSAATMLTAENMQLMMREHQGVKADPVERMWQWLATAGPPYDSSPSVRVRMEPTICK